MRGAKEVAQAFQFACPKNYFELPSDDNEFEAGKVRLFSIPRKMGRGMGSTAKQIKYSFRQIRLSPTHLVPAPNTVQHSRI